MIDIYSLLNIQKEQIQDYPLLANRVIDYQFEKVVNKNIDALKQIKDRMLVDKGLEIPQRSIEEVISKVLYFSSKKDDSLDNWSNHELRIISYYLMKLRNNAKDYYFALSLLDNYIRIVRLFERRIFKAYQCRCIYQFHVLGCNKCSHSHRTILIK